MNYRTEKDPTLVISELSDAKLLLWIEHPRKESLNHIHGSVSSWDTPNSRRRIESGSPQ